MKPLFRFRLQDFENAGTNWYGPKRILPVPRSSPNNLPSKARKKIMFWRRSMTGVALAALGQRKKDSIRGFTKLGKVRSQTSVPVAASTAKRWFELPPT